MWCNVLKYDSSGLMWIGSLICMFYTQMEMMMEKAGNRHLLTVLTYPDAGHLIEPPYSPHFRATNFMLQEMKEKSMLPLCIFHINITYLELFNCVICRLFEYTSECKLLLLLQLSCYGVDRPNRTLTHKRTHGIRY